MSLSVNIKKKIEGFTLDVAFEAENEFFAVLGESGCGHFDVSQGLRDRIRERLC